jgi:hypothetical protein
MKVPAKLIILGVAIEIMYCRKHAGNRRREVTVEVQNFERKKESFLLACNQSHTALFIFEADPRGQKKIILDRHGLQRGAIHTITEYNLPTAELQRFGTVAEIRYYSDMWSPSNKFLEYRHEFDTHPSLATDRYSDFRVMAIKPARGKIVSPEGIIK